MIGRAVRSAAGAPRPSGSGWCRAGEVGIVVANLGLAAGLLSAGLFSAVLVAVVLTTVMAPYLLVWVIPRAAAETDRRAAAELPPA